jgi:hypothetical protein
MQRYLGASTSEHIHVGFAAVALISLGLIALAFGWREQRWGSFVSARIHFICAGVIAVALIVVVVGHFHSIPVIPVAPIYAGEVATIWAFGVGWLYKAWDVWRDLRQSVI